MSKFGNRRVEIDGLTFDSVAEGKRYLLLRDRERSGEIANLEPHPTYRLEVNGVLIGRYTPDFRYVETATGALVVEDVKSGPTKTQAYRLRKKLLLACHGITVSEVMSR